MMSDGTEKWDEDEQYLYERAAKIGVKVTNNDIERFVEKVAIKVIDGNIEEDEARKQAFNELYG